MKRTTSFTAVLILLTAATTAVCAAERLPAFPGAEGFGAGSIGGRGGQVIKVTNLNARGPGSLQAACSAEGPRTVVFDVSGVIPGDVVIEHGRISIMGQTAPGAGVTIAGMLWTRYNPPQPIDDVPIHDVPIHDVPIHDVVVRFLRVRPTGARGSGGDAIQFSQARRVILDHVSCSWACDETIDVYSARDVTVQWCSIEESAVAGHPKGRHNYGLISGPGGERISIHHNLFAHHARRCPAIANGPADVRNNVIYNFRDGLSHEGHKPNDRGFNLIGNYYKRGPSDPKIFPFCFRGDVSYYLRDNFIEGVGIVQDPWAEADKLPGLKYYARHGQKAADEFPVAKVTTHSPRAAYKLVLERAGCFPRDTVSRRIVREVQTGTGAWGRAEAEQLMQGLQPQQPPEDTDKDGMPDAWEKAHELDADDGADHRKVMQSGYTAIEEYCYELAAERLPGETDDVRFTQVTIDRNPPAKPYYKMLGDIDGDGLLDIVVGGADGPLVWYRYPSWAKTEIASGGWRGVKGIVGDVDSDGDADIVMGGTVWFRNPRIGGGRWRMVKIDTQKAHDVELGDLDLDGCPDVVARDQSAFGKAGNRIYVYRQKDTESWEKHTIGCPHGEGLKLADLDRDSDPDIVIGGRWYENTRRADRWIEHRFSSAWTEPDAKVEVADFNGDGRLDIVLSPAELRGERYKIAWYEAPEDPRRGSWKEHVIVVDIEAVAHSLVVGDFNLDGDVDLGVAEMHQGEDPDEVMLLLNLGKGNRWRKHVLSNDGSHDLVTGDIGADGDLDIVGANHAGPARAVELWRNDLKSK